VKLIWVKIAFVVFICCCSYWVSPFSVQIPQQDIHAIAEKIWKNECGGTYEKLIFWNEAEPFPSLGIGHFIWFPSNISRMFEESFPVFIRYVAAQNVAIPSWLYSKNTVASCPWNYRSLFMDAKKNIEHAKKMKDIQDFMYSTIDLQAEFIIHRFEQSIDHLIKRLPEKKRDRIVAQLTRIASTKEGVYALIDYVNFKGTGLSSNERYCHHGWGLLQVLEGMRGNVKGKVAVQEFIVSARAVLLRRVTLAPPTKNERRFLLGWYNRLKTYVEV
jgi:hypothetical protein